MIKNLIRNIWESKRCYRDAYGNDYSRWWLYPSYIRWRFTADKYCHGAVDSEQYFAAIPNRGAGIGHQMSNWHAGLWYMVFGLKHAHVPFAQSSWERFIGYGAGETTLQQLHQQGYKIVHLPFFNDDNAEEMEKIKQILTLYAGKKVVFVAEQDQHYPTQII